MKDGTDIELQEGIPMKMGGMEDGKILNCFFDYKNFLIYLCLIRIFSGLNIL